MNRKTLREYTHNAENFLKISNDLYKQWVFRYTFLELEKDLGLRGDITTASIFPGHLPVKAAVIAKQDGIFAGCEELKYFLVDADAQFMPKIKGEFSVNFLVKDGAAFKKGERLLEIEGDVHDVLAVERASLNLIMRMSGVATFTAKIVDMVRKYNVLVTPTRKCLWGLLDKKAVVLGGGGTHRLNMADAILVKDNHAAIMKHNYEKIFEQISDSNVETRFVEVEVNGINDALKLAEIFSKTLTEKKIRSVGVMLMDNMSAGEVSEAMKEIKKAGFYDDLLFEASGGVNESNIIEYAATGVDIVSMGALTNGVRSIDMSMKIV